MLCRLVFLKNGIFNDVVSEDSTRSASSAAGTVEASCKYRGKEVGLVIDDTPHVGSIVNYFEGGGLYFVFRVRVPEYSDSDVVVKLAKEASAVAGELERYAILATLLQHTAIPKRLGHISRLGRKECDASNSVVLTYMPGCSLYQLTKNRREHWCPPLGRSIGRVCRRFILVATILADIHGTDIVHRDLKLGNLLVDKDTITKEEKVAIIDVDNAARMGDDTARVVFSEGNFDPTIVDRGYTPASDIYALSAALYEALTLQPSTGLYCRRTRHDSRTRTGLIPKITPDEDLSCSATTSLAELIRPSIQRVIIPPTRHNPALNNNFDEFLLGALQPRVEDRLVRTTTQFIEELERVL